MHGVRYDLWRTIGRRGRAVNVLRPLGASVNGTRWDEELSVTVFRHPAQGSHRFRGEPVELPQITASAAVAADCQVSRAVNADPEPSSAAEPDELDAVAGQRAVLKQAAVPDGGVGAHGKLGAEPSRTSGCHDEGTRRTREGDRARHGPLGRYP